MQPLSPSLERLPGAVAQEIHDRRVEHEPRLVPILFPIGDSIRVRLDQFRHILLEKFKVQPSFPDMIAKCI
jgi:hypothetical protein